MYLGELGEQYFIKSQKAFKQLNFVDYTIADKGKYYSQRIKRDSVTTVIALSKALNCSTEDLLA